MLPLAKRAGVHRRTSYFNIPASAKFSSGRLASRERFFRHTNLTKIQNLSGNLASSE